MGRPTSLVRLSGAHTRSAFKQPTQLSTGQMLPVTALTRATRPRAWGKAGPDHRWPRPRARPRKATQLRGRIHAAARAAAEGRQTTCYSTHSTITIGIRGPHAQERVNQLRRALGKLIAKH